MFVVKHVDVLPTLYYIFVVKRVENFREQRI